MSTISRMTGEFDITPYATSYRALLERLSLAVQAMSPERRQLYEANGSLLASMAVRRISDECNALINCMVVEMREARKAPQSRIRVGSGERMTALGDVSHEGER
jgi:hypothetical protein